MYMCSLVYHLSMQPLHMLDTTRPQYKILSWGIIQHCLLSLSRCSCAHIITVHTMSWIPDLASWNSQVSVSLQWLQATSILLLLCHGSRPYEVTLSKWLAINGFGAPLPRAICCGLDRSLWWTYAPSWDFWQNPSHKWIWYCPYRELFCCELDKPLWWVYSPSWEFWQSQL